MKVVPLTKIELATVATVASTSAIDGTIQRTVCQRGLVRTGKGIISNEAIPNEDISDIIRIIKSGENSGVLLNRVSETVKHEIKG